MRYINTVFSQLLSEVPRSVFKRAVDRHHGDKRAGSMSCWTQFCTILYGQLSSKQTLRDTCLSWASQSHYIIILEPQKLRVRLCPMPIEASISNLS
ncbi:MAG: DUF4372 domain-containing protein [Ghiorsea sp.]|nr:DUF4372 domain-containing protein [Ghiorsea sp.]